MESFKISIPRTCSENFNSFERREVGSFCSNCSKVVIDFSTMTNKQIQKYFENVEGITCGRFRKDQLKTFKATCIKTPNTVRFSKVLRFSLLTFLPFFSMPADASVIPKVEVHYLDGLNAIPPIEASDTTITVKGQVLDEVGQGLPGAQITVKGTTKGIQCDVYGSFSLPDVKVGQTLIFSFIGYNTQEIKIKDNSSSNQEMKVTFEESDLVLMGEVQVERIYSSGLGIWSRLRNLF